MEDVFYNSFFAEFDRLEKGASVKGVVKGTMLTAALAGGLAGGGAALRSRASAQARKKQFSEKEKSKAWGRILGRKEQAKHQLGLVQSKEQKALKKLKAMSDDPKFKFSDPRDKERAISHVKHMDVLSKKRHRLKGELKEHETARRAGMSILPKGRITIGRERKLALRARKW